MKFTPIKRSRSFTSSRPFRVMILGSASVGKSALAVRFVTKRFIGEYDSSTDHVYNFNLTSECEERISYEINDVTQHQLTLDEENSPNIKSLVKRSNAFIVMYSVDDVISFEDSVSTIAAIRKIRHGNKRISSSANYSIALVGNKTDLNEFRQVSESDGHRVAKSAGNVEFHEISVRESFTQCHNVFKDLYRAHTERSVTKTRSLPSLRSPPSFTPIYRVDISDDFEDKVKTFAKAMSSFIQEKTPKFGRRGRYSF